MGIGGNEEDLGESVGPGGARLPKGFDAAVAAVLDSMPATPLADEASRLSEMFSGLTRHSVPVIPHSVPDWISDLPAFQVAAGMPATEAAIAALAQHRLSEIPQLVAGLFDSPVIPQSSAVGELIAELSRRPMPEMPNVFADVLARSPSAPLMAEYARVSGLALELTRETMPLAPRMLAAELKVLDSLTPAVLERMELAATAQLARTAFPDTSLEAWRSSLLADADVARLSGMALTGIAPAVLEQLAARTTFAADLGERLVLAGPGNLLVTGTAKSTRAWGQYIALKPTPHRLRMSSVAGTTVGGLMGGDLLLRPDGEEVAEQVDQQLVEPWQAGNTQVRIQLFAALRSIDPQIVSFIEGGWEDVVRSGPAAPSKIAHCVAETVDHTLRALAPPDAALAWLQRDGRRPVKGEVDQKGVPTRRARVAYALRDRPGDRRLVQSQADALASLVVQVQEQAQGIKHAPGAATVTQARTLLVTAEALLVQLVPS